MEPAQRDDEIFDVVDVLDRVISQATRREVHDQGLLHRAVHILILNSSGEVFLQKRSMAKDTHPNCWASSASGHLDAGEDYLSAAIRECKEELGVSFQEFEFLFKITPSTANGWEFVEVYQGLHEGPFSLNPAEISEGQWYSTEAICSLVREQPQSFASSFIEVWRKFNEGFEAKGTCA